MQLNQFNSSFHIVTKKEHFQINALFKLLYLRTTELEKRWKAGHIQNWSMILNQLMMNELFASRIEKSLKKFNLLNFTYTTNPTFLDKPE